MDNSQNKSPILPTDFSGSSSISNQTARSKKTKKFSDDAGQPLEPLFPDQKDDRKRLNRGADENGSPHWGKRRPGLDHGESSSNALGMTDAGGSILETPDPSKPYRNEGREEVGVSGKKAKRTTKKVRKATPEDEADDELAKIIETFGTSYWKRGNSDDDQKNPSKEAEDAEAQKEEEYVVPNMSTASFHQAAAAGKVRDVKVMLEKGFDVGATDGEKATAIHHAAQSGAIPVIKLLINSGGDINAMDQTGKTPLYWAAKAGKATTVKHLLDLQADPDIRTATGWTPLHTAARDGSEAVVKVLLDYDFNVDARSQFGVTPLYLATLKKKNDSALLLLEAGADPKLKSVEGVSPIINAVRNEDKAGIRDILNALVPDLQDQTYDEMIDCLLTDSEEFQYNSLWTAVERGNEDFLSLFLALGVDLEKVDEDGCTLLHIAVSKGNFAIVQLLLKYGADTEAKTEDDGSTALLMAADSNRADLAELLLDYSANIEAKTAHTGRTALHVAANLANAETRFTGMHAQEARELVRLLLKRGAYFGATDTMGYTPLQLAQRVRDQSRAATDVLLNPPAVEGRSGFEEPMPPASKLSSDEEQVCQLFNAFIVDFDSPLLLAETKSGYHRNASKRQHNKKPKKPKEDSPIPDPKHLQSRSEPETILDRVDWLPRIKSIHEVVHSDGPKKIMQEAHQSLTTDSKHLFRWIHVPANNIAWVKDLVHKICLENGSRKGHFEDMANFVSKTGSEHWGAMAHSRYMKTSFTQVQGSDSQKKKNGDVVVKESQATKLAIYMPFLNFDTTASRKEISAIIKQFESPEKTNSTAAAATQRSQAETGIDDNRERGNFINSEGNAQSKRDSKQIKRRSSLFDKYMQEQKGGMTAFSGLNNRRRSPGSSSQHRPDFKMENSVELFGANALNANPAISNHEKYKMLLREYLSHRHGPIHISRTLDQFYYNSIATAFRDQDQVVHRFSRKYRTSLSLNSEVVNLYRKAAEQPEIFTEPNARLSTRDSNRDIIQSSGGGYLRKPHDSVAGGRPISSKQKVAEQVPSPYAGNPRIFTVDQMWIWIIDEETIISSFPQRWGEEASQEPKVLETIQAHLSEKNRPQVKSVYEMAAMITSHCMKFTDRCSVKGNVKGKDFEESFMQIYASAVSNEADREARLFKKFQDQILAAKHKVLALEKKEDEISANPTIHCHEEKEFTSGQLFGSMSNKTTDPSGKRNELMPLSQRAPRLDTLDQNNCQKMQQKPIFNMQEARAATPKTPEARAASDSSSSDEEERNPKNGKRHRRRKLEEKSDISGEIEVLKEIKDIRDELNILHRILEEQKSIADKLFNPNNRLKMSRAVQDYYLENSGLERRIQDVVKMDKDAQRTYQHVNNLLDLKQKQANIDEALAGATQGRIAANQGVVAADHAKIAADQGAVVLIFTLVTIIFLPMSFLTSLYALNISSFPHDEKGDLAYPSSYLFSRLFAISTAIAVVLITLAFQVRRIRRLFKKRKERLSDFLSKVRTPRRQKPMSPTKQRPFAESKQNPTRYSRSPTGSLSLAFRDIPESKPLKNAFPDALRLRTPSPKGHAQIWSTPQGNRVFQREEVSDEAAIAPPQSQGSRVEALASWMRQKLGKTKEDDLEARQRQA